MDLSPLSDRAFDRALQLAGAHEAHLTLVHVIDDQMLGYGHQGDDLEADFVSRAEAKLRRHWLAMPEAIARRFDHTIKTGAPSEEILCLATEKAADLIVLGLHRVNPLKDVFVGTTAERIIRNSMTPVLVVKDKPVGAYDKVVASTDFSPCSSHALQAVLNLVPSAEFELLHVFETPFPAFIHFGKRELESYRQQRIDEAMKQIRRDLDAFLQTHLVTSTPRIEILCKRGGVIGEIGSTVRERKADLLALGTHGRSGILGAMLGSVAVTFLTDPPCDVLVSR
jgi:nucleotide-binding universal stress UspA family protein